MRNYIQTYRQFFDHFTGGVLDFTLDRFSSDADEAAIFAASLPPFDGSDGFLAQDAGGPAFVLLTKEIQLFALNSGAPYNNSGAIETESPRFGIGGTDENPTYVQTHWPSNDGDPRNPTAEEATKKKGTGSGGFSFKNLLQQVISRLLINGGTRANLLAGLVGAILFKLLIGKFSVAQAMDAYAQLVAENPDINKL